MRMLIAGGGIAGLTLAHFLSRHGMTPVVIERAKDFRQEGYALDFFGIGYEVAERMGLVDRLCSEQIAFDSIAYVNAQGKRIAKLDAALLRQVTGGKYLALMRPTLEEALYEALEGRVEVRFGRWCVAASSRLDAVEVTFNDGTTEFFDLLIGADGVHSGTRELVFGPDQQFCRNLGYTVACYPLADRYGIGCAWNMYVEPGRMVAALCTPQAGELLAVFMYHGVKGEPIPRAQRLAHLREVFSGMGWLTEQFLVDAPASAAVFMDAFTLIQMPTWHRGRVALVGDACGCPTPLSGQGASLAMAGAYLLARALHETATYQEAFHRYEQQMRPYVQAQQKNAHHFAKFFLPDTPLGVFVQQTLVKIVFREAFRSLLRREFSGPSLSMLHPEHHIL